MLPKQLQTTNIDMMPQHRGLRNQQAQEANIAWCMKENTCRNNRNVLAEDHISEFNAYKSAMSFYINAGTNAVYIYGQTEACTGINVMAISCLPDLTDGLKIHTCSLFHMILLFLHRTKLSVVMACFCRIRLYFGVSCIAYTSNDVTMVIVDMNYALNPGASPL